MILSLAGVALQIVVTVAAPETLTVRQPATLTVRADVRGPEAPVIQPPRFAPLSGIRIEESTLIEMHGKQYEGYRRRVPALLPRIRFWA